MKRKVIMLMLAALLLLTGCWDRKEINDVAFVMGSAVDREGDQYRTSLQIALPGQMSGGPGSGGGDGAKAWALLSRLGETVRESNSKEQAGISRQLNFSHRRTIVFGQELAEYGIKEVMDVLGRIPQNRLSALLAVSQGKSQNLYKVTTNVERFPAEMIRELLINAMKDPITIKETINRLLTDGVDLAVPILRIVKEEGGKLGTETTTVSIGGMAVFKKDKLVKQLHDEEAMYLLLAMGEAREPEVLVQSPKGNGKVMVKLTNVKVRMTPAVKGDKLRYRLKVLGKGVIIENTSNYEMGSFDHMMELQHVLNEMLGKGIERTLMLLASEHGSDPVGFERHLSKVRPADWARLKEDWERSYRNLEIETISQIRVDNTGTILRPFGIQDKELVH